MGAAAGNGCRPLCKMAESIKPKGKGPLKVYAFGNELGNAPFIGPHAVGKSGEDWMKFGNSNLFPEFCCALVDNCAPLSASVEVMSMFIAGSGIEFLDSNGEPMEEARRKWEDLCDGDPDALIEATSRDIAMLNTMAWVGRRSAIGLARIDHIDVARIRSGKIKDEEVKEYFFSSNWSKYKVKEYEPIMIPAWGERKDRVLLYRKSYKNLRDYYGEPHWLAAMVDAEVLARIPVFNRTQLDTGFKPAIHAHLTTSRDQEDLEEIDEDFEMVFTGADGKSYVLTVGAIGEDLKITKLERGDHAGELDKTRAVSKEEIWQAYGIPPILMGANVPTGMSGRGLAITEELSLFQTTKVVPKQKHICVAAKMVLKECGIDVPLVRIKPLVPFEPAQDPALLRQTYLRSRNVGEDRIKTGMPVLTTDGKDAKEDMSNWTDWMLRPLIEVGMKANTNEEEDAEKEINKDDDA